MTRPHRSRIGIITGSGPEAGLDLWAKVLRANRQLLGAAYDGDLSAPEVVIFSVRELGLSMELQRNDGRRGTRAPGRQRHLAGGPARRAHGDGPRALIIYEVKRRGADQPDIAARFARVLAGLRAEVALLACTELPLIPVAAERPRVVDVTDLLALALARRSLEPPEHER